MIIRYGNGYTVEAVLLSRADDTMRVAVRGGSDVLELRNINGRWVSEDCEPVDVEFAWLQLQDQPSVSVNDCICSPELAAKLLHLLFSGEDATAAVAAIHDASAANAAPVYHRIV
jgi:hypothetical protein